MVREGEVIVFRVRTDRTDAGGIYGRQLGVQHFHIADVVYEDRLFQDHHEALAVHLDGDDHAVERELTYCRVSLHTHEYPSIQ